MRALSFAVKFRLSFLLERISSTKVSAALKARGRDPFASEARYGAIRIASYSKKNTGCADKHSWVEIGTRHGRRRGYTTCQTRDRSSCRAN